MTAPMTPRQGLFTRKQSPMQSSNAESSGPGDQEGPPAETGQDGAGVPVTCPQCGCQFDPEEAGEMGDGGGGTSPEQLAQMLGLSGGGGMQGGGPPMGGM